MSRILPELQSQPLLAGLCAATLSALAAEARVHHVPAGRDIVVAGDAADGLRLVLSGCVRLSVTDSDGRALTLAVLASGDVLGEMAPCDGLPFPFNATAETATRLGFLRVDRVHALLLAEPVLALRLARVLSDRLRASLEARREAAFGDLRHRLGRALCDLAPHHAELTQGAARFARRISQDELARHLGVSREAVNRQMRTIRAAGEVAMSRGRILIPDFAAFRAAYAAAM